MPLLVHLPLLSLPCLVAVMDSPQDFKTSPQSWYGDDWSSNALGRMVWFQCG